MLGPAFVAAIAYVDPGNFATNFTGGAKYGYLLLWVIVAANLMAMLIQSLSGKVGLATGRNLAELCRENRVRWSGDCGCKLKRLRWRPTWQRSSVEPSR